MRASADDGVVTAEFAVLVPALLAFVLLLASVLAAAAAQVSVANAAREAGRMLSRGEPLPAVNDVVRRSAAGVDAVTFDVQPEGDGMWVDVAGSPRVLPGPMRVLLPPVRARLWVLQP